MKSAQCSIWYILGIQQADWKEIIPAKLFSHEVAKQQHRGILK